MLGAASVDQELVVEVGGLVALRLVCHVYREIFPVSLHLVVTQSIHIVVLGPLPLALVPARLVGHSVVRNQTFRLRLRVGGVGLGVVVVNRLVGWFVQGRLSETILHINYTIANIQQQIFATLLLLVQW